MQDEVKIDNDDGKEIEIFQEQNVQSSQNTKNKRPNDINEVSIPLNIITDPNSEKDTEQVSNNDKVDKSPGKLSKSNKNLHAASSPKKNEKDKNAPEKPSTEEVNSKLVFMCFDKNADNNHKSEKLDK